MTDLVCRPELCYVISNTNHIMTNILSKIQNATSRVLTGFFFIWPRYLDLFYLIWPMFQHGLDIIKTNIIKKYQLSQTKNAASGV